MDANEARRVVGCLLLSVFTAGAALGCIGGVLALFLAVTGNR